MAKQSVYNQLHNLTHQHFGDHTQSFLEDLIQYHLNINPESIKPQHIAKIADWLEITSHLISEDETAIRQYMDKVRGITGVTDG
ncbi:MAG: hypothetical protein ACYCPS_00975 [Candidatus Saccharimonadales bacterium]